MGKSNKPLTVSEKAMIVEGWNEGLSDLAIARRINAAAPQNVSRRKRAPTRYGTHVREERERVGLVGARLPQVNDPFECQSVDFKRSDDAFQSAMMRAVIMRREKMPVPMVSRDGGIPRRYQPESMGGFGASAISNCGDVF